MNKYDLIVFDVDGTLVEPYTANLLPGVLEWFETHDHPTAFATNQGGVGLRRWMETEGWGEPGKYPTEDDVSSRLYDIQEKLGKGMLWCICYAYQAKNGRWAPTPDDGDVFSNLWSPLFRKPMPGMLLSAMANHRVLPERTLFVGDMDTDQEAAFRAGCGFAWADMFFGRCDECPGAIRGIQVHTAVQSLVDYMLAPGTNNFRHACTLAQDAILGRFLKERYPSCTSATAVWQYGQLTAVEFIHRGAEKCVLFPTYEHRLGTYPRNGLVVERPLRLGEAENIKVG